MTKKKIVLIVAVILVVLLAVAVYFRIQQTNAEISKRPVPKPNVILGKAVRGEIIQTESLTGDILPIQQANIFSRVSGNIEKIYVNIGDFVKHGQILALIDTSIYAQNVKMANANYIQTIANVANTKMTYERNQSLLQQNLISKQDADNTKTAYDVALSQKDAAYANYTNALTQLSYCKITAPFTGYITKKYYDPGVYVTTSTTATNSTLFTMMDIEKLKAIINVPEKDVISLPKIIDIKVTIDALPGMVFNARINKISGAIDLSTRTMQVEIYIDNPGKVMKPGMFATISLILDKKENVLIVPNETVQNDIKGNYIFVFNPDSTVTKKYVQLGILHDNKDEITSGISDDDILIVTGQTLVRNGGKVRVVKAN